jgi:hypothetical protein
MVGDDLPRSVFGQNGDARARFETVERSIQNDVSPRDSHQTHCKRGCCGYQRKLDRATAAQLEASGWRGATNVKQSNRRWMFDQVARDCSATAVESCSVLRVFCRARRANSDFGHAWGSDLALNCAPTSLNLLQILELNVLSIYSRAFSIRLLLRSDRLLRGLILDFRQLWGGLAEKLSRRTEGD